MIFTSAISDSKLKTAFLLGVLLVTLGSLFIDICEGAAIDSLNSIESSQNQTDTTNDVALQQDGSSMGNGTSDPEDTCAYNGTSPFGLMDLGVEDANPEEVALAMAIMMADARAAVSEVDTEAKEELDSGTQDDFSSNETASSNGTDLLF